MGRGFGTLLAKIEVGVVAQVEAGGGGKIVGLVNRGRGAEQEYDPSDGPGVREGIRKGPAEKVGVGLEVCEQLDWEATRETALRKSPPRVSILRSRDDCISLCSRVETGPRSTPSPLKVCSGWF
jgi:hypothetical protein